MTCKLFKLVNGDMIIGVVRPNISLIDSEVEIENPVQISSFKVPMQQVIVETFVMQTWLKMARSTVVKVPTRSIVVMTDVVDKAETQYYDYLKNADSNRLSDEELEQLTSGSGEEDLFDFTEDEEDDGHDGNERSGPTLH